MGSWVSQNISQHEIRFNAKLSVYMNISIKCNVVIAIKMIAHIIILRHDHILISSYSNTGQHWNSQKASEFHCHCMLCVYIAS